jgi:hypothetical protein
MMTRHRQNVWAASAVGLALCLAAPAEAAQATKNKATKKKPVPVAHSMKDRHAAAARPGFRYQGGVPAGPLYNGQDYIGDDPDPNIRSYLIRDMTRYGGPE